MNKTREGFTLVEVVMALMILSVAILGMQAMSGTMLRRITLSNTQMSAIQLAEDRLDLIRLEPNYAALPNYAADENPVVGWPNFRRITSVVQTSTTTTNGTTDYRKITVEVRGPGGISPVIRSITIGAP
jgi:prepilin-type N-terminal cleavage/methylation domain-containing protein